MRIMRSYRGREGFEGVLEKENEAEEKDTRIKGDVIR